MLCSSSDSEEFVPFQPPEEEGEGCSSSMDYPRTPLLVGENDDTSLSELEHSMSPHPQAMLTKRPDTLDSFNDADVDDYSTQDDGGESTEPENQGNTLYFGQQEEKDGEFMVNAMDVEELRRSQRRYRAGRGRDHGSEEEDEECSTPSAENSDRNMASMLCVSMESVEQVGRRERFLQSTFESLSGGEELSPNSANSNSISAQQRNAGTIAAARQTRDADQNRRREELQRRIEETRQKLQNVRILLRSIRRPIFIFLKYFHLFLHFSDYSFACDVTQTDNEM